MENDRAAEFRPHKDRQDQKYGAEQKKRNARYDDIKNSLDTASVHLPAPFRVIYPKIPKLIPLRIAIS